MKSTHCENCGDLLVKPWRRWCGKPECRVVADKEGRKQSREYFKRMGGTRRRPESIKPKGHPKRRCIFPPDANPEHQCGKVLKDTDNYYYCKEHHKKVHVYTGIDS